MMYELGNYVEPLHTINTWNKSCHTFSMSFDTLFGVLSISKAMYRYSDIDIEGIILSFDFSIRSLNNILN